MAGRATNRSISMILRVPDIDVSNWTAPILEEDGHSSAAVPRMPVYQGLIVRIDRHTDDKNMSDLIIRIPNFQRRPLPSEASDTKRSTPVKRRAPICPVMQSAGVLSPAHTSSRELIQPVSATDARSEHSNRLTTGLRSLGRAFTHTCRSKRTVSITEITLPRSLPDVEVITTGGQPSPSTPQEDANDHAFATAMPRMRPPQVMLVKRKDLTVKKRQVSSSSSNSSDRQPDPKHQRVDLASTSTIPKQTSFLQGFSEPSDCVPSKQASEADAEEDEADRHQDLETASFSYEVEQEIKALSQLVSDQPASSIDADSLSTHRYSSISAALPEASSASPDSKHSPRCHRAAGMQTSLLRPDISVVRIGTSNLTTDIGRALPAEKPYHTLKEEKTIEQELPTVDTACEDTLAECYEVTYQVDPNAQLQGPSVASFQITLDPSQYRELATRLPSVSVNEYENIERESETTDIHSADQPSEVDANIDAQQQTNVIASDTDRSPAPEPAAPTPDASSTDPRFRHCTLQHCDSYDGLGVYIATDSETQRDHFIQQVEHSSPGDHAGLKEHDRILCINGTPVVDEDYTVVLQLIKHGLDTDTLDFDVMVNEAYEQFKAQINQLYQ